MYPGNYCTKIESLEDTEGISLTECKLTCGDHLQLWPLPTGKTELGKVKMTLLLILNNMTMPDFIHFPSKRPGLKDFCLFLEMEEC